MPTPNLSSPRSIVEEEILLELCNRPLADHIGECVPSPEYHPTSPSLDPHDEALEIAEAMIIMSKMENYTLDASYTPRPSEAIHLAISPVPPPTPDNKHCILPSEEEVHNVQKLARAILCY